MLDLLQATVDAAAGHCDYAEARHVHTAEEHLAIHDKLVDAVDATESEGVGVRVGGVLRPPLRARRRRPRPALRLIAHHRLNGRVRPTT